MLLEAESSKTENPEINWIWQKWPVLPVCSTWSFPVLTAKVDTNQLNFILIFMTEKLSSRLCRRGGEGDFQNI